MRQVISTWLKSCLLKFCGYHHRYHLPERRLDISMRTFKDTRGKCWYDIVPELSGQIDIAVNYPGTIRAFHYHRQRTEWLFAISGDFKVILKKSKTETI